MKSKEIEIENKDVYMKIEPYDSIDIKKALLEIEASAINMQIIAERLKEKTRQEIRERAAAKRQMRETANMVFEFIEGIPKPKEIPIAKRQIFHEQEEKEKVIIPKKEQGYARQLEELRKKIASLD